MSNKRILMQKIILCLIATCYSTAFCAIESASAGAGAINELSPLTIEAQKNTDLFGPENEPKDIYLNFEGAELKSFVEYIADMKGMNIIPDKSIAGNKISLNFRNPVTKTGAWNAFLTILEMANFSMIKVGNLYRIVARDKKFKQPLPTFIGVKASSLPETDATIRYIALLNNLPAQDVKGLLSSMLSQPNNVIDPPNINGFIITDCASTIKAAMQILEEFDLNGLQESVYVMQLKRANARDVKTLFDTLIAKPDGNPLAKLLGRPEDSSTFFTPGTKIIAEDRTNKLILMGQRQALEKIKTFITDHVDTELKQAKSPLRIYELQNANAADIVTILQEVTDSSNSSAAGQQAAKYGAIRDGVRYFKNMKFKADKEGNRLLVSCTDDNDWALIQQTIKALDTAQPQVAMQMLIVTVTANAKNELGGQVRNTPGMLGDTINFQSHPVGSTVLKNENGTPVSLLGNLLQSLSVDRGASMLSLGKVDSADGIFGILRALKTEDDATILSQPFALAANCTETKIEVGEQAYVVNQESGGTNPLSGKVPVKATTCITFTPQVNNDGVIKLKIDANISEFVPGSESLSTQTKKLNTMVTVANGQVLVIGGFVKTKVTDSGGQTPIWGSIPILGWLAKSLSRSIAKEYLFLFLCPTIIKPRTTPGIGMYSKINLHQAAKEVEETIQTTKTNDPIHNWFFNPSGENYSHKIIDFANARYQPNNVDIRFDPYYRSQPEHIDAQQTVLEIDDTPSSPQTYWKQRDAQTVQNQTLPEPTAAAKELSTNHEITAPTKKQPAPPQPQSPPPATKPIAPAKIMLPPQMAEPTQTTVFTLDESLAEKRSKLRSLLSQNSLGDLLAQAPEMPITNETEEQAADEEQPLDMAPAPAPLSRRQGIQNLFTTPTSQDTTSSVSRPLSSGLQALLGGK